jgi:hypothetical protein
VSKYGFSESEARAFLRKEIAQAAASTSFYWESDELEDVLDLVIDAVAKLLSANNARLERDLGSALSRSVRGV